LGCNLRDPIWPDPNVIIVACAWEIKRMDGAPAFHLRIIDSTPEESG